MRITSKLAAFALVLSAASIVNAEERMQTHLDAPVKRVSNVSLIPEIAYGSSNLSVTGVPSNVQLSTGSWSYLEGGILAELGRGTFVFQSGLTYMKFGATYSIREDMSDGTYEQVHSSGTISYLGVPLAAKVRFRIANGIRLAGRLGVVPSLLIASEGSSNMVRYTNFGQQIGQAESTSDNSTSGLSTFNLLGMIGLGPEFRLGRDQNVRVESLYEAMIFRANSESSVSQRFSAISAMLSYGIGF